MGAGRGVRFLKFNAVGAIGIVVQLAALALFRRGLGLNVPLATGLAVETAVLHNFIWHERWTWKSEEGSRRWKEILALVVRFHLGSGGVSLLTNVGLTGFLTARLGMNYLIANLISIGCAGVLNFAINEFLVFRRRARVRSCP